MAETQINRRPVRASLYGLVWGLSLFVLLVWESVILLDSLGTVIVKGIVIVVAAIALSLAWAFFGPVKKPKGARPAAFEEAPAPVPEPAPPADGPPAENTAATVSDETPPGGVPEDTA